jgi:hypothetical protein
MKSWLWGLAALALAACSGAPQPGRASEMNEAAPPKVEVPLKDYGPAPELTNEVWLNTDRPLRLADLRGKVVLIDFWTFG